jgi:hypothetical protein
MQIKIFFALAFLLFIVVKSVAQFKKGDKMVGTSVASGFFNSGTSEQTVTQIGNLTEKSSGYSINLSPTLGWFLSEKMVVGFLFTINPAGEKKTYEIDGGNTFQKDKSNSFNAGAGAFVRNYFSSAGSLLPFGQVNINGGISNLKKEGFLYLGSGTSVDKETYDGKSSGGFFFTTAINGGVTKMMGEYTGLDFFIGYTFSYNKNTFKRTTLRDNGNNGSIDETRINETTTKFTNHGFQFGIGFQVFLKGKK